MEAGRTVLVDATHAKRPWRLALTQGLVLSRPVEWIGWWLRMDLEGCKVLNRLRPRQVADQLIEQQHAALGDSVFR